MGINGYCGPFHALSTVIRYAFNDAMDYLTFARDNNVKSQHKGENILGNFSQKIPF